jgi:cation diffusion facilitator family transporter
LSQSTTAKNTIFLSIASSLALALIKFTSGYLGESFALIADALESVSDVFASSIVLLGLYYSSKPPDKNHPYGHGKIEPLITFVVVSILSGTAVVIAYESIENIKTPHELPKPFTLIVLGLIILWKEITYRIVVKKSIETGNTSLRADAWHHRSDAITSLAAFIGISFAIFMGKGFEAADDWAALLASGYIIYNSFLIFKPAFSEVMDEDVYGDIANQIEEYAKEIKGIVNTEKCKIRKSGAIYYVDIHVRVPALLTVADGHKIAHQLKDLIKKRITYIAEVHIHIEPA